MPFSNVEFLNGETFVLREEPSQEESALPLRVLDSKEFVEFFAKAWVLLTEVDPGIEEKLEVIKSAPLDSWIQEVLLNLGRGGFGVLPVFKKQKKRRLVLQLWKKEYSQIWLNPSLIWGFLIKNLQDLRIFSNWCFRHYPDSLISVSLKWKLKFMKMRVH